MILKPGQVGLLPVVMCAVRQETHVFHAVSASYVETKLAEAREWTHGQAAWAHSACVDATHPPAARRPTRP